MPKKYTQLSKAPIQEAIIEFQLIANENVTMKDLNELSARWEDIFSKKDYTTTAFFGIDLKQQTKVDISADSRLVGVKMTSTSGREIVNAALDRFSVSILEPYKDWEELSGISRKYWSDYLDVCKPKSIKRIGTRVINNIKLTGLKGDLEEYFVAPPVIPEDLDQEIRSYLTRVTISDKTQRYLATVTQLFDGKIKKFDETDGVSIILDIDAYLNEMLNPSDESIWAALDDLHQFRNDIFFSNLTPKSKDLYK